MSDFLPSPAPGQQPWVYLWHRDLSRWWLETKLALTIGTGSVDLSALQASLASLLQRMGNVEAEFGGITTLPPFGSADQVLGMNHAGSALSFKSVLAGTGIAIVSADGTITISNTGVTSVALSLPAIFTVSGSPVTSVGTLTAVLATQGANVVFAGPSSGGALAPTFRALVAADLGSGATAAKYLQGDMTWVTFPSALPPNGAASGDLSGSYPNPTVAKANGNAFPASVALGDLLYGSAANTLSKLAGNTTSTKKFLRETGAAGVATAPGWDTLVAGDIPTAAGDVSGAYSALSVDKIKGRNVSASAPSDGQILAWSAANSDWEPANPAAGGSGLGAWSSATTYGIAALVVGSDNNYYRSVVASNLNHDPTTDDGTNWELWYLASNLTLTVSTAGTFRSLTAGTKPIWNYIQNCRIAEGATLTISISDGTYTWSSSQALNHPFGARINITGNTTTPANVVLSFSSGTDGLVVNGGFGFGLIDGVTIDGVNKTANKGGIKAGGNGAYLAIGAHVTVKNFDIGIFAANRGQINGANAFTVTTCNTGVFAQNQGWVAFSGTATSCTTGIYASIGSSIVTNNATSSSNTTGCKVDNFSYIYAVGITNSGNTSNFSQTVNSVTSSGNINN